MFGLAEASSDVGGATSESADSVYLSQIKVKIITMRLELYFTYQ